MRPLFQAFGGVCSSPVLWTAFHARPPKGAIRLRTALGAKPERGGRAVALALVLVLWCRGPWLAQGCSLSLSNAMCSHWPLQRPLFRRAAQTCRGVKCAGEPKPPA